MSSVKGLKAAAFTNASRAVALCRVLTGVVLLALMLPSNSAFAQSKAIASNPSDVSANQQDDTLIRKVYGGVGLGISSLAPDTSEVPGVDNKSGSTMGAQFMIGLDFNKWFSIEGHAASLGEAEFEPSGSLGYQTMGVSGLVYVGKNSGRYNRHGLNGFGRVGFGVLKNTPSDGLRFKQLNSSHLLIGAGVEYATRKGLGIRAEAIAFDTDVVYAQLSVLYRLGRRTDEPQKKVVKPPKRAPVVVPKPKPKPVPKPKPKPIPKPVIKPAPKPVPAPVVVPAPKIAAAPADTDFDGVQNARDRCPNTQKGVAVDEVGCALFSGVIEGVNFNSGSAVLTQNAQVILNGVIKTLNRFPSVKLTIMAHTDSQGDAAANKSLSKQRARSVAIYLIRNGGIKTNRLKAFGFGEDRPIDTNETAQGRLRNRRVEFQAAR